MDYEYHYDPESVQWCEGCMYFGKNVSTCDFLLRTGERRGCPPGEECTRYAVSQDYVATPFSLRRAGGKATFYENRDKAMLAKYNEGWSDVKLGEFFRLSRASICSWRKKRGLEPNKCR